MKKVGVTYIHTYIHKLTLSLLLLLSLFICALLNTQIIHAAPGEVLILDTTVSGGINSLEATKVSLLGKTPVVVNAATWGGMTTGQFASYDAIVLGDATCGGTAVAAEANVAVWGTAITGNVVVIGTDPRYHQSQRGDALTEKGIAFAIAKPGKTGAYITLSCYYHGTSPRTPVPLLSTLSSQGGFTVMGVGCYNNSHIVATHPALEGLTDADLSNWSCSVHEAFDSWPADFMVLAIAKDIGLSYTAPDGTVGTPYILARGAQQVLEKPTNVKHVVIIDIDGLRPDTFKSELEAENLDMFEEILGGRNYNNPELPPNRHAIIVEDAETGFPSLTLPGHASIFTGCYINRHGIYGNNWFDRKEVDGHHYLQVLSLIGDFDKANKHLKVDTIYEAGAKASEDFSALVGFNFYIGEKYKSYNTLLNKRLKWITPTFDEKRLYPDKTNDFDQAMMYWVLYFIKNNKFPDIVTLYFAAVDHKGHEGGVAETHGINLQKIDEQLGWLINGGFVDHPIESPFVLTRFYFKGLKHIPSESGDQNRKLFDDTVFVICSDHGQSGVENSCGKSICYEELEAAIKVLDSTYVVGRIVPTEAEKGLKTEERALLLKNANIVLELNDGMAQVYVRNEVTKDWKHDPRLCEDIMPVARLLKNTDGEVDPSKPYILGPYILKRKSVSMILVKDRNAGEYKVFNGVNGCTSPLEKLGEYFEGDEAMRINKLYDKDKSGDIVILANYDNNNAGYYLSDKEWANLVGGDGCPGIHPCPSPMKATHGNINSYDLKIPFIIAGKPLEGKSVSVSGHNQVDIAPTVADILNFSMPCADGHSIFQGNDLADRIARVLACLKSEPICSTRGMINAGETIVFDDCPIIGEKGYSYTFSATWQSGLDSTMKLTVYEDGGLLKEAVSSTPPIIIEVKDVHSIYTYEVTAVDVPFDNYGFAVAVGKKEVACQCPEDERGGCISGTVRDLGGDPFSGKTVILKPLKPNRGERHRKAVTDSNGCYIFSDLKNGRYRVWVIGRCRASHQIVKIINNRKADDVNFGCR